MSVILFSCCIFFKFFSLLFSIIPQPDDDVVIGSDTTAISSPLMDTERTLGLLVGLHSCHQARSLPLSTPEVEHQTWLTSQLFSGGLQLGQRPSLFHSDQDRSDSSRSGSQASTPSQPSKYEDNQKSFSRSASQADAAKPFLQALADFRNQDLCVKTFLSYCDKYSRTHHLVMPLDFPPTHPVEVTGRLIMACILKHHDLGHAALALVEHGAQGEGMLHGHGRHGILPKSIADVCRVVHQAKRSLIKVWRIGKF